MPWICKDRFLVYFEGERAPDGVWSNVGGVTLIDHSKFPSLFEFVEEKDQSGLNALVDYCGSLRSVAGECYYTTVCKNLIHSNAIKPEFLEKLRNQK